MHSGLTEQELIAKLTHKVSEQAMELQELSVQLDESKIVGVSGESTSTLGDGDMMDTMKTFKTSKSKSFISDAAAQRRLEKDNHEQMVALQKQLTVSEGRLADHIKAKRKLLQDMESKTRENKFLIKKCQELQSENQNLRTQLESAIRIKDMPTSEMLSMSGSFRLGSNSRSNSRSNSPSKVGQKGASTGSCSKTYANAAATQKLVEDVRSLQHLLEESKKEASEAKEKAQHLALKVRVLEDALEFRSEEIGLSGHSDLLAKVAQLRGEVTALKAELSDKHSKISEVEVSKDNLSTKHDQLQRQVKQVQQRLAHAQQEAYRLQNGDLGTMLKAAEDERDKLLNFVKSDMQKSSELAKQVERLETDLRVNKQQLQHNEGKCNALEERLATEQAKVRALEQRQSSESSQTDGLQRVNKVLVMEKESLAKQLSRKNVESDELNKVQMNLFMQVGKQAHICM